MCGIGDFLLKNHIPFDVKVVENEDYYYQARATALSAIAKWSPPDALRLIADRLADGESDDIVRQEISDLLDDTYFLRRAADADGIPPGAVDEIPSIDAGPDKWKQWRKGIHHDAAKISYPNKRHS